MDSSRQQQASRLALTQPIGSNQVYGFLSVPPGIFSFQFDKAFQPPVVAPRPTIITSSMLEPKQEPEAPKKEKPKRKRTKERAGSDQKKLPEERIYKCNRCSKTYLSYPALYTHTKLKHVYSKDSSSITNGRMRGRPKKTINVNGKSKVDPTSPLYFRELERKGGPIVVTTGFEEAFREVFSIPVEKYKSYRDHPLYVELNNVHRQFIRDGIYDENGNAPNNQPTEIKTQSNMEEHEYIDDELTRKREKSCDQIFAEYLGFVAQKVRREYYIQVLRFVFLFRECINSNGERLIEDRKNLPEFLFPKNSVVNNPTKDYCCDNNGEQVPDMCNEFLMRHIKERHSMVNLENTEMIELMQNLCYWMFINGYTCSKIALIE